MTTPDAPNYEQDRDEYHRILRNMEDARKEDMKKIFARLDAIEEAARIAAALSEQRRRLWRIAWGALLGAATVLTGAFTILYALGLHR